MRRPATIANPSWLRRPTGSDVQRVFPPAAMRAEQYAGDVTVECKVPEDGALAACAVLEEKPQGFGFGAAGLKLTERFRLITKLPDGRPTAGGTVRIPLMLRAPNPY